MTRRYKGLKPNPQTLGVIPLNSGELSRPVRVRASQAVHDWLKTMTALEVGAALERVMLEQQSNTTARYAQSSNTKSVAYAPTASKRQPTELQKKVLTALRAGATLKRTGANYLLITAAGEMPVKSTTIGGLQVHGLLQEIDGKLYVIEEPT